MTPAPSLITEIENLFSEHLDVCPVCSSTDVAPAETVTNMGIGLSYSVCHCCHIVFQSPRIPESALAGFYEDKYRLLYEGQIEPTSGNLQTQSVRAAHLVDFLLANGVSCVNHLDIGSGSGALLLESRKRMQCAVTGVELDNAQREFAVHNGVAMSDTLNNWQSSSDTRADLVSLSHVLEHIPSPVVYLRHLRDSVLTADGMLLIEVPHLYVQTSLQIAHTVAFTAATLRGTLARAGFAIVATRLHSQPYRRSMPIYITALATPDDRIDPLSITCTAYTPVADLSRKINRFICRVDGAVRRRLFRIQMP